MANRLCARVAQAVLLTYETTRGRLVTSADMTVVGVPVASSICGGDRAGAAERYGLDPARTTVLFVGGSLGAARINELALALASDASRTFQVLHLCGQRYEEEVRSVLGSEARGYSLVGYEDQMALAYAMADLVVCRAGSSTLAELCAVGKGSLLIPSPNVTENHQEANARGLESEGAAEVLVEEGWSIDRSVEVVKRLVADEVFLKTMGVHATTLARMEAAENAADVVEMVLGMREGA
jgi:UDP-N-acetylglucosamine--N-acetylmuramyl-(pentapeptide) pyrophosphoryl-undecaprenol N-acetylglucosamine transferase